MTIYFCLLIINKMFQIKFLIMLITLYLFINFVFIWRIYDFHLNLKFNWIFNILRIVFALIQCFFNVILTFMLYFFKIFEKWIISCFRLWNLKSYFSVHSTILFHVFLTFRSFVLSIHYMSIYWCRSRIQ